MMKTKKGQKKTKAGRKCLGLKPLTNQERQARKRAKLLQDPERLAT